MLRGSIFEEYVIRQCYAFALITLLLGSMIFPSDSPALTRDGEESFRTGLELYRSGDYAGSVEKFEEASRSLPVVGDYALIFLAKAYLEEGKMEDSANTLKELLSRYPASPVRREATRIAIRNAAKGDWDNAIELLVPFVDEFKDEEEMRFLLAELLSKRGRKEEAQSLFRQLYLDSGALSDKAYDMLQTRDFMPDEVYLRAAKLIERKKYSEAEDILRSILLVANNQLKPKVLEKLGLALFMQKKYHESANVHIETGNLYLAAKSFLRAGKHEFFEKTLDDLVLSGDENAVELLIANAMEKQSSGNTEEALKELSRAILRFPLNAEKAWWQTGWIYYLNKEYKMAARLFSKLYDKHESGKYLYWRARAVENDGGDAMKIYEQVYRNSGNPSLNDSYENYYIFLSREKLGNQTATTPSLPSHSPRNITVSERIDALIAVGLVDECIEELEVMAKQVGGNNDRLVRIAFKLMEIKQYHKAIRLMTMVSADERPVEILYPLAFWEEVKRASTTYGLDPYLLLSLIREESRFDEEALSTAGAIGLMQLMPNTALLTARKLNMPLINTETVYQTDINIKIGSFYLNNLIERLDSISAALAAYNAGEQRVRSWLKTGRYSSFDEFVEDIPFKETRNYVKRILGTYFMYQESNAPLQTARRQRL